MSGAALVIFVLAFLPALLPLAAGRLLATIGIGALCLCAAVGLIFFVVPGIVLWFAALFLGIWSANSAKRDRQHRELLNTMAAGQYGDHSYAIRERCRRFIRAHKPAFSNRLVYDCSINGEQRRFTSEIDAVHFVSSRLHPMDMPSEAPAGALPSPKYENYKGIRYVIQSDYSIEAETVSGSKKFASMFVFREWADEFAREIKT